MQRFNLLSGSSKTFFLCGCFLALGHLIQTNWAAFADQCPKGRPNCQPTPKPTPRVRPTVVRNPVKPKLTARTPQLGATLNFDKAISVRIDWGTPDTGAIAQPNGSFTLYNEFPLNVKNTDVFALQLQLPKPPSDWELRLVDSQSNLQVGLNTNTNHPIDPRDESSGFTIDSNPIALSKDGQYRVQVRLRDVAATNTQVSLPFILLAARISPITLEQGDQAEMSTQTARKIPQKAGQVTYFKEHLLNIFKSGRYSIELWPPAKSNIDLEIYSYPDGQKIQLNPRSLETGEIQEVDFRESNKYRLRVLVRNASRQMLDVGYAIKFNSVTLPREAYLAEIQKTEEGFKGNGNCELAIKSLEKLTISNANEAEAYLALGKLYWQCRRVKEAYATIEQGFKYSGKLEFEVLQKNRCGDLDANKLPEEQKNGRLQPAMLKLQKGKIEIEACRDLHGRSATAQVVTGTAKIEFRAFPNASKPFYAVPANLDFHMAQMIADLVTNLAK